jgi:hypothetical protein
MRAWLETCPPFEEFAITADEIAGGDRLAFVRGTYAMTIGVARHSSPTGATTWA